MVGNNLLEVKGLKIMFPDRRGFIKAVEGIDLEIEKGESVAIVGESGCGKSVTALAIMKLLPVPPALISVDSIVLAGEDISSYKDSEMQNIRGNKMSMVFQNPMTSLNPVMTIGKQIDEILIRQKGLSAAEAKGRSIEVLRKVGVPAPEKRYHDFPHQLSGGMKQRVLIAIAFACEPDLMIADEPTTALDVTIQAQILDLLVDLKDRNKMSLLLITHDLSVVANMADSVYVMYSGQIVERGTVEEIFSNPLHPYTNGLLRSVPSLDDDFGERFVQIPDTVPHPINKPKGCYFHPRCEMASEKCKHQKPILENIGEKRDVRCWNYKKASVGM